MEQFRKGLLRIIILSVGLCLVQNSVYTKSMPNKYHSAIQSHGIIITAKNLYSKQANIFTLTAPDMNSFGTMKPGNI